MSVRTGLKPSFVKKYFGMSTPETSFSGFMQNEPGTLRESVHLPFPPQFRDSVHEVFTRSCSARGNPVTDPAPSGVEFCSATDIQSKLISHQERGRLLTLFRLVMYTKPEKSIYASFVSALQQ